MKLVSLIVYNNLVFPCSIALKVNALLFYDFAAEWRDKLGQFRAKRNLRKYT